MDKARWAMLMTQYADEIEFIKWLGKKRWTEVVTTPRSKLLKNYIDALQYNREHTDEVKEFLKKYATQELLLAQKEEQAAAMEEEASEQCLVVVDKNEAIPEMAGREEVNV